MKPMRQDDLAGVRVTQMIGRDELLISLTDMLSGGVRLLTLSGAGGVGKTRLALAVVGWAEEPARDRWDRVAVVRLADIGVGDGTTAAIQQSILAALDLTDHGSKPRSLEEVLRNISDHRVLLVLDNAEHILDPVADVVLGLLAAAPQMQIVITTRHRLDLTAEHVVAVPPVSIPDIGATYEEARASEAVSLLLQRAGPGTPAAMAKPGTAAANAVVELAQWSGGLPLVLELIASQIRAKGPEMVLTRLNGGRLLTATSRRGQRHHQTLDEAQQISWELCSPAERDLWAQLSVFAGGFDLNAAEQVCGLGRTADDAYVAVEDRPAATETNDKGKAIHREVTADDDVLTLLTGLVDWSVVEVGPDGRYHQHQPLQEYGMRRLEERGQVDVVRGRHAQWMRRLTADAALHWFGADELEWLAHLQRELPNIRATVDWALAARTDVAAEAAIEVVSDAMRVRVHFFCALQRMFCEWMAALLGVYRANTPTRLNALAVLGFTLTALGDVDAAGRLRGEWRSLAEALHATDAPPALFVEGAYRVLNLGDAEGHRLLLDARDRFRAAGLAGDGHMAGLILTIGAGMLGPAKVADSAAEDVLTDAEAVRAPWAGSWARWAQGLPMLTRPRYLLDECLPAQIRMGDKWGSTWTVEQSAWWRAHSTRPAEAEEAARLLGGCVGLQERHGVGIGGLHGFHLQRRTAEQRIAAAIGHDKFLSAYQEGLTLSANDVYELALGHFAVNGDAPARPARITPPAGVLTPRELKVAALIAKGQTNRAIALQLHAGTRTIEGHVGRMLAKLNFQKRAQIAAWYSQNYGDESGDGDGDQVTGNDSTPRITP